MKHRPAATDEEYQKIRRIIRLVLLRAFLIWAIGFIFLFVFFSKKEPKVELTPEQKFGSIKAAPEGI